ncbi:c-type cytochrome biogenesis protein CcsB [Niallia sp. 03133]|uniref:c-type cytochrome biogenesis protein CcsB n=1 Tax=Niallia sp. 03133 TaxID=3458060 RepID=UPI004044C33B
MVNISSNFLYAAFLLYFIATILFAGGIKQKKKEQKRHYNTSAKIGMVVAVIAFFSHFAYFVLRWAASGHAPVSNLFEFICFFSLAVAAAFILLSKMYRTPALGLVTLPLVIILIAYANMFPNDVVPLIPALQSSWLQIHVITAALGEGILSISFVAGFIYLLKNTDDKKPIKSTKGIEWIIFLFCSLIGFILLSILFSAADYKETLQWIGKDGQKNEMNYHLPAVIGPADQITGNDGIHSILTVTEPLNSSKLNSMLLSLIAGCFIYFTLRLICKKRIGSILKPVVKNISLELLDEISYRSVLIGFPVFTLGALIFAMIWAQIAWSRFWNWDPKEVWALITWLFYAAFLHLRLTKDWQGEKSAWLVVIGFIIIMFNLIAVNLIMVGLHAYA